MAEQDFFTQRAKESIRAAIRKIEDQTSAEVVVAVRRYSDSYRQTDFAFGFALAFSVLVLHWFVPTAMAVFLMPFALVAVFALGVAISSSFWSLKRRLTSRHRMQEQSWRLACSLFVKLGISKTRGRSGVLVVVSMLERRVTVVCDVGVEAERRGEGWKSCVSEMQRAVESSADFEGFARGLERLGPLLAARLPSADGDLNELPDDMDIA